MLVYIWAAAQSQKEALLFMHTAGAEMCNLFVWTGEIPSHVVFNEVFLKAGFCADGKPVIRAGVGSCAHKDLCAY